MPMYEYCCEDCKKVHEVIQKFSDEPLSICPDCGGTVKKLISNTSFILKGTGWYATDYASPERKLEKEKDEGPSSDKKEHSDKKEGSDKKESSPSEATASNNNGKAEASGVSTEKANGPASG